MYLPILTYHRLLKEASTSVVDPKRIAVSQAQFRSHLAWLSRLGYRSLSLAHYPTLLRERRNPSAKSFAITFDDGYEDVLTLALPVLQEFRFTATVFAVPGQLGGTNVWDDSRARLLTADQYRILQKEGITIGGHTSSHVHLPQVDTATARREISESKKQMEEVLGTAVTIFAYPYGESTPDTEALVRDAGFEAAFATDRASRDHSENPFRLRRAVVFPRNTVWNVLWKAQPWYPAYQDFKRRRNDTRTR
jgi:peptidoglycan/xylan/chitin deacetylase (PgdA/CDA1 family)